MVLRPEEADEAFKQALKNPSKPVNNTSSPQMEQYLDDMNNGRHIAVEKKRLEDERLKRLELANNIKLCCPKCHRPTLKRNNANSYSCGYCGLSTNAPNELIVR